MVAQDVDVEAVVNNLECSEHDESGTYCKEFKEGVYRVSYWVCDYEDEHECNCEYCEVTTEICGRELYWVVKDPTGFVIDGYGSCPRVGINPSVQNLINDGVLLPQEAWIRLPGFD